MTSKKYMISFSDVPEEVMKELTSSEWYSMLTVASPVHVYPVSNGVVGDEFYVLVTDGDRSIGRAQIELEENPAVITLEIWDPDVLKDIYERAVVGDPLGRFSVGSVPEGKWGK